MKTLGHDEQAELKKQLDSYEVVAADCLKGTVVLINVYGTLLYRNEKKQGKKPKLKSDGTLSFLTRLKEMGATIYLLADQEIALALPQLLLQKT